MKELKEVILTAIEEVEKETTNINNIAQKEDKYFQEDGDTNEELIFLTNLRERLHVLFEGFQSPYNKNTEAKLALTLKFLEFLLANTEDRIEKIKLNTK